MEFLRDPWPWYIAGPMISLTLFLLLYFGKTFGVSSNLRTACTILGAGKVSEFFKIDWKNQVWNLVFVAGSIIGGFITAQFLSNPDPILLSHQTIEKLESLGFTQAGENYLPDRLFAFENLSNLGTLLILLIGGFLVGFGTRYAGGCTSGHAITGLSNLQLPSLIAVIGFFIGGLIMVHFIFPIIF